MKHDRSEVGFVIWFAICAILGIAMTVAIVWLIVVAAQWIARQS